MNVYLHGNTTVVYNIEDIEIISDAGNNNNNNNNNSDNNNNNNNIMKFLNFVVLDNYFSLSPKFGTGRLSRLILDVCLER